MKTVRQANFEVLRIIAMFMILLLHANFLSFGFPAEIPEATVPITALILRTLCETLCLVAVNLFVMISGYWGINVSYHKLFSFCFQIFFWSVLTTSIVLIYEKGAFDEDAVSNIFMLNEEYWFVKSYLLLFIMAPVLNTFTKIIEKKEYLVFLVLFFSFQLIFGWLYSGVSWFQSGYSTISFIGLYLLAGYLRRYKTFNLKKRYYFLLYLLVSAVSAFSIIYFVHVGSDANLFIAYNSPFVLIGTIMLFLFFEKLEVKPRKYIFFLSSSCFSVYLMHCNEYSIGYFCEIVNYLESITSATGGTMLFLIVLLLFLSFIFVVAVLVDKIRIHLSNWILRSLGV